MAGKSPLVKRYVVRLEPEKRDRLEAMLRKGKHRAQALTKARILMMADHVGSRRGLERRADHRGARDQSIDGSS